jgi:ERCC4-related helicase
MSKSRYTQGQRILCRGEEWQIQKAILHKLQGDEEIWELEARGLTGIVQNQTFRFIDAVENWKREDGTREANLKILEAAKIEPVFCSSREVNRAALYIESHLRKLLPRNGAIYLGSHGAINRSLEYQLDPAAKALGQLPFPPRIMIADAVGLGKTIECGILISELIRRSKGRRILCAVPKATLEQFQNEMWGRFSIPFHRLDSLGLQKLRQDLPSSMNPFYHFDKVIISIDTLKIKSYEKLLENCEWDVVVIDECHNVAVRGQTMGSGSARHRVAKKITKNARSVVLMSATPHDGTKQGFASLIKLLDRTAIAHDDKYDLDTIKEYFIRRTRSKVSTHLQNKLLRKQHPPTEVPLSEAEVAILEKVHKLKFAFIADNRPTDSKIKHIGARELFRTTLIKSFLSSPAALKESVEKKLKDLKQHLAKKREPDVRKRIEADKLQLEDLLADIEKLKGKFTRLLGLMDYIRSAKVTNEDRLVIFTERLATQDLLAKSLVEAKLADGIFDPKKDAKNPEGSLLALAHGSLAEDDLGRVVKAFQNSKDNVKILIATNVASEGLNLHHLCHRLVHFDLPWSLITLEQRNGRIDRVGQEKRPEIFYYASKAPEGCEYKDDFWIINKLKSRMQIAGEDLEEEALRGGFTSASDEEAHHTLLFETDEIAKVQALAHSDDLLAKLMAMSGSEDDEHKPYRAQLPTLFKTPAEFIKGAIKEANLKSKVKAGRSELEVELTEALRAETEQWPRCFRPDQEDALYLEEDPQEMSKSYERMLRDKHKISKAFLNEIHPAIGLFENLAAQFFEGEKIPLIAAPLGKSSVAFLVQATLFNKLAEPVFQSWQVVQFDGRSDEASGKSVIDLNPTEPKHTLQIVDWVSKALEFAKAKRDIGEPESRLIQKVRQKAAKALEWLEAEMKQVRKQRMTELRDVLVKKSKRIKDWEAKRRQYLEEVLGSSETEHGGLGALKESAKRELQNISEDSKRFQEFVKDLASDEEPDMRIIACFYGVDNGA